MALCAKVSDWCGGMEVIARARYIRMSPRKVRLVVDLVRGLSIVQADTELRFLHRAAALPVRKAIASAAANAVHNNKLSRDRLYIKAITVDQGPSLRRFRARAFGRAAPIRKRSCHITVVVTERAEAASAPESTSTAVATAAGRKHS